MTPLLDDIRVIVIVVNGKFLVVVNELGQLIGEQLEPADLNAMSKTSRRHRVLSEPILYARDAAHGLSVLWAALEATRVLCAKHWDTASTLMLAGLKSGGARGRPPATPNGASSTTS